MADEQISTTDIQTDIPPKKKTNTKKIVIIVVVILLLLCLIVSAIIGIVAYFGYGAITKPIGPIKNQLAALNDGNIDEAYEKYTSSSFKNETSAEAFDELVKNNPQIFESKSSSFSNVNIKSKSATVKGSITGKDGTVTPMTYDMVFENNKWLILGFRKTSSSDSSD